MINPFAGMLDPDCGRAQARTREALPDAIRGDSIAVTEAGPLVVGVAGGCEGADGVLCVIDGAVYNCEELGEELGLEAGQPSEKVLAYGYRRWGGDLASRLRGEFAALLWDRREQRGLLIPDQIGVRRLVVRRDGRRLWFGSDVRNVLALLPARPGPNPVAVSHWLARTAPPEGETLYQGIDSLGSGQMIELNADGWTVSRYWQPEYEEPLELSHSEWIDQIRVALQTAVGRRTTLGAPIGILMSGGLDSTSVAALAKRASPDGAWGFSSTFPDYPHIDESAWIEALESHIGLPGVHLAAKGRGILASGIEYLGEWDLPLSAWNEAWTQPLHRRAAEMGVTAMLSGEGGDELFGSRFLLTADLMRQGRLLAAARYARGLPEAGGRAPRDVLAHVLWKFGIQGVPSARVEAWLRRLRSGRTPRPGGRTRSMASHLE